MTPNAQRILDIINTADEHLSAEQIYLQLKKDASRIVLATVYNNLKALQEAGKIRKVSVEGYPDRYDKVTKHDHLVCKQCGRLTDIVFSDLTSKLEQELGEAILCYDLKVSYICPACRKAAHTQ